MLTITVKPHLEPAMMVGADVHRDKFAAYLSDRLLCVSWTPFFDAARVLLAEGCDPETPIAMRHDGASHNAMTATLGIAARTTVSDVKFRPAERVLEAPPLILEPTPEVEPV